MREFVTRVLACSDDAGAIAGTERGLHVVRSVEVLTEWGSKGLAIADDSSAMPFATGLTEFTVDPNSNRLVSGAGVDTRSYSYDLAGNVLNDGVRSMAYNAAGRMISASGPSGSATYLLNGLGQRVRKMVGTSSRLFFYDEAGHLLGEYDQSGALIQETVWLGDLPVATLRPNGPGGVAVFYVHADHLGTPRKVSRPSDNQIVWRWDADPFGAAPASEDPDGDGAAFVYALRFPGQYHDAESGLNYNYFRDYDPATGRYVQSDPMSVREHALVESILPALTKDYGDTVSRAALELNPYAYVVNNPVSRIDPTGADEEGGKGGGDGGGGGGGIECRLVGTILAAYIGKPWLPHGFAVLLCFYDCNTSCPGSADNILMKKVLVYNAPFVCPPKYRRRLGE